MAPSPSTKAMISSLLIGLSGFVMFQSSSTNTTFKPSFRKLEEDLSTSTYSPSKKETGFYTSDIGFFTVTPWDPATWSVDFTTKAVKKLNSLLFSSEGPENMKGSILCTDELCQAHGKATTAVLVGYDEMLTADLEVSGTSSFEVCFTCPPGKDLTALKVLSCKTDLGSDCTTDNSFAQIPAAWGDKGAFRTGKLFFRDRVEPMPNIVRMKIKFTCEVPHEIHANLDEQLNTDTREAEQLGGGR